MGFEWFGDKISDDVIEAVKEGAYLTAEQVLTNAKNNCPQDTGTLRRSGTITFDELPNPNSVFIEAQDGSEQETKRKPNFKKVYVSFNTPYANKQHEDLSCNHAIGEAKYLEKALNEKSKNLEKNIKFAVKKQGLL